MRFYDLKILNPAGKTTLHYTSYPGGLSGSSSGPSAFGVTPSALGVSGFNQTPYDPGALNCRFDLLSYPQATPMGASWITLEGVPQNILTNAGQFVGQQLIFKGGMGSGLPLANPQQAGLLVQGYVYQAFGNREGTQLDLTFLLLGSTYTISNPGNIVLNWIAGTPLATALQNTLKTAYPNATIKMNISNIVLNHTEVHFCSTLTGLAQLLSDITSTNIVIVANGTVITVTDNSFKPAMKQLVFTDFIGQPMWIDLNTILVKTVLRADIQNGDHIRMPPGFQNVPGFVQTAAQATTGGINYVSAIQGDFVVNEGIRHVGDFRQPSGHAWCSIIRAAALTSGTTTQ
ncbi:MAG TPA: hypothetical protein VMB73_25555 [Acetobacteraceae bacterium]|nr:hypothetical protein [Acetobacteraceae bacterium]